MSAAEFGKLATDYLDDLAWRHPDTATSLGDHRFDDRLRGSGALGAPGAPGARVGRAVGGKLRSAHAPSSADDMLRLTA